LFHALPTCQNFELQMPAGAGYAITRVWQRDHEAGFSFDQPIEVPRLINEDDRDADGGEHPRRAPGV
jgi:hypothetical protein